MVFNTLSVASAVVPSVLETGVSHYLNRKPLHFKPTAHISYHVGLRLIRQFLDYSSRHTVEDVQAFTAQWVPSPRWVRVEEVEIPYDHVVAAAERIQLQLGPDGLKAVGGLTWWQWRPESRPLRAEWIEMRKDFNAHKQKREDYTRCMLYVHGGAYYFGSVDEHRYQMQRHARKLQARVLAPRYRLAPQYPFPCGLLDCLAAYMYLLTVQPPETIILAGDSAGGGMVVSLLVILRDQDLPMPAGAILLSPWVDLTHSFPSVANETALDYISPHGFMHRPSMAWPPPNSADLKALSEQESKNADAAQTKQEKVQGFTDKATATQTAGGPRPDAVPDAANLSVKINKRIVEIRDQIQLYTTNALLSHPLVSAIMQPSLGGLPPLFILTGGGEILRDEQIYLAHKAAAPPRYPPPVAALATQKPGAAEVVNKYPPTYVQLQVWDDMCHVAPTLSFTRPAKFMYRSVAQFGAWALAQAQNEDMAIVDDDDISFISSTSSNAETSGTLSNLPGSSSQFSLFSSNSLRNSIRRASSSRSQQPQKAQLATQQQQAANTPADPISKAKRTGTSSTLSSAVGKAGDELPAFNQHMIRQRVTRHGEIHPLPPAEQLPACTMDRKEIGVLKPGPVRKWMRAQQAWGQRYAKEKRQVQEQRLFEMKRGYVAFEAGERPPPTAVVGHRTQAMARRERWEGRQKGKRSRGLALWSGWGSAHDEDAIERETMRRTVKTRLVQSSRSAGAAQPSPSPRPAAEPEAEPSVDRQYIAETSNSNSRPSIDKHVYPVDPPTPQLYVPQTPVRTWGHEANNTPLTVRSTSTARASLFAGSGFTWDDQSLGRPTPERVQRVDEARKLSVDDGDVSVISYGRDSPSPIVVARGVGFRRVGSGSVQMV